MVFFEYLKSHPISYKSFLYPFCGFGLVSIVVWLFILLEINPGFFGGFLSEQVALKWIWLFASVSIIYLSVKFIISGPVTDYDNKYVKSLGIYFANTALAMSSTYVGIMWGALVPVYFYRNDLPLELAFTKILVVCVLAAISILFVYAFYLVLTANKNAPRWHYQQVNSKTFKFLVGMFCFAFISGRLLDLLRIFKPDLF
ncbi:hypothetical protein [Neptuniibacter sp. QD48_11]|uniref:hypothetical protein n=1 Tax=Neptuniibacter sp. QD48_11 TaxID=3398211 RepID=UPI0039F49FBA